VRPRVVIAAPLHNGQPHVAAALGSLLAQTQRDFRLVLVDDASTDGTAAVAEELAAADERVAVHRNPTRLGMLGNTRRAWALARAEAPDAEFVALASDHDRWHADWLTELVGALDANPRAVLAYPQTARIDAADARIPALRTWRCDTAGEPDPFRRLRRAYRCMVAGDMIYGLMRADALGRVGGYRSVLVPDRLLLSQLALLGEFVQVPRVLWERRFVGLADLERQRRAFWPDGAPRYTRVPWWVTHAGLVAWEQGVLGETRDRRAGARLAGELLAAGARLRVVRRVQGVRLRVGRALEGPVRAACALRPVRELIRRRTLPVPADTQDVLERLLAESRMKRER
jgi:hypothetical protein